MKKSIRRILTVLMIVGAFGVAGFQQATGQEAGVQGDQPSKEHQMLLKDVGTWEATMRMWMAGPDEPPMEMPATEVNRAVGELWLVSDFESGPFKGHGVFGYDQRQKKFVGTWMDNMTTHLSTMEGEFDKASGQMTMYSEGLDPATGELQKMKTVSRFVDNDTKEFVAYTKSDSGEWIKSFEINYKRKQG